MSDLPPRARAVEAFERGEMVLPALDHEGHVYLAWCYLGTLPLLDAVARFPAAIRRFAVDNGAAEKYNATLTLAYLLLIHQRMQREPHAEWQQFRSSNPDLFRWPDGPLAGLYSAEVLHSPEAKQEFIPPDRTCTIAGADTPAVKP